MREAEKLFAVPLAERHSLPEHLLLPALDYVLDDRVESGIRLHDRAAALVRGFTDVYRVSTSLAPPWEGTCTCGRPAPCRHQAAVVLALDRGGDRFLTLPPGRLVDPGVWAETLFRTLIAQPDALEPLRNGSQPDPPPIMEPREIVGPDRHSTPEGSEALPDLAAMADRIRPGMGPMGEAQARDLARQLLGRIAAGPVTAGEAPAVATLLDAFLDGLDAPLEAAVRALFLSLGDTVGGFGDATASDRDRPSPSGPAHPALAVLTEEDAPFLPEADIPLRRVTALLETAIWQTALPAVPEDQAFMAQGPDSPDSPDSADPEDRAHRAADLLLERIREHSPRPAEAVAAVLETHAVLPALSPWHAAWLFDHGHTRQGEHLAMSAYINAHGLRYRALRSLLLTRIRDGSEGPRRLLLAEWEASPTAHPSGPDAGRGESHSVDPDQALAEILAAAPASERPAIRRHAQEVLTHHHAYASLCRLSQGAGDLREAARWALADGRRSAPASLCLSLATSLLAANDDGEGQEALTALELLSAAFRRETDGQSRQAIVQRARALTRREASLSNAWAQIRRRYFPEPERHAHGLHR